MNDLITAPSQLVAAQNRVGQKQQRLSFGDIVREKKQLERFAPQFREANMDQFVDYMQQNDPQGRDFSAGRNPNFVKYASSAVDDVFEATKIPQLTGELTESAAQFVGLDPDFGESVGRDLPRGAAEVLSQAGWFFPGPGWAVAAAGLVSAGSKTFTETDSIWAGVVDAATTAATPFVGLAGRAVGAGLAARSIGGQLVNGTRIAGKSTLGTRLGQAAVTRGTEELAQIGLDAGSQLVKGLNPLSAEALFANLISSTVDVVSSGPAVKRLIDGRGTKTSPFNTEAESIQARNINKVLEEQRDKFDKTVDPETTGPIGEAPTVEPTTGQTGDVNTTTSVDNPTGFTPGETDPIGSIVPESRADRMNELDNTRPRRKVRTRRVDVQRTLDTLGASRPSSVADVIATQHTVNRAALELNKLTKDDLDVADIPPDVREKLMLDADGKFTSEGVLNFVTEMQKLHDEPVARSVSRLVDHVTKDIPAAQSRRTDPRQPAVELKPTKKKSVKDEKADGKLTVNEKITDKPNLEAFNRAVLSLDDTETKVLAEAYASMSRLKDVDAQDQATSALQTAVLKYVKEGKKGVLKKAVNAAVANSTQSANTARRRSGQVSQDVSDETGVRTGEVDEVKTSADSARSRFTQNGESDGRAPETEFSRQDAEDYADYITAKYGRNAAESYLAAFDKQRTPQGQADASRVDTNAVKRKPKAQLVEDWNRFAAKSFEGLGLDESVQQTYMHLGQRVLSMYKDSDVKRIFALRKDGQETARAVGQVLGVHVPAGRKYKGSPVAESMLGLVGDKVSDVKEFDAFYKTSLLAHEQFHSMVSKLFFTIDSRLGKDGLARKQMLQRMFDSVDKMDRVEREDLLQFVMQNAVPKKFLDQKFVDRMMPFVRDTEEYLAMLTQIFSMHAAGGVKKKGLNLERIQEMRGYLSPEVEDFLKGQFFDMKTVAKALSVFSKENSKASTLDYADLAVAFEQLSRTPTQLKKAQQQLLRLNTFLEPQANVGRLDGTGLEFALNDFFDSPDMKFSQVERKGLRETMNKVLKSPFDDVAGSQGVKVGLGTRLFGNPLQWALSIAEEVPIAREIVANLYNKTTRADAVLTNVNRVFFATNRQGQKTSITKIPDRLLTTEQRKLKTAMGLVSKNPKATRAFSDIALKHNNERENFSSPEDYKDIASFQELSSEQKEQVLMLSEATKDMNQRSAQVLTQHSNRETGIMIAKLLTTFDKDITSADAQKRGFELQEQATEAFASLPPEIQTLLHGQAVVYQRAGFNKVEPLPQSVKEQKALRARLANDPEVDARTIKMVSGNGVMKNDITKAMHERAVEQFAKRLEQAGMDPELVSTVARMHSSHQMLAKILDRPYFFTERRVGDFIIKYKRNGEEATEARRSKFDADARVRELQQDPDVEAGSITGKVKSQQERFEQTSMLNPTAAQVFADIEQHAYNAAVKRAGEKSAKTTFPNYVPGEAALNKSLQERTKAHLRLQEQKPGREFTNLWESAVDYSTSVAYSVANAETRHNAELQLRDPQMRANPEVQKVLQGLVDNETTSAHKEHPILRSGIFTYFLGYNFSSAFIETSQSFLTTLPQLTRMTGSIRQSSMMLGSASKTLAKAYNARGFSKPGRLVFDDQGLQKAYNRALDENIVSYGVLDDVLTTPMELDTINARRLTKGLLPLSMEEAIRNTAHLYVKGARAIYSVTSGTNARIAFIAGYELGKQRGLTDDALFDFATEFTRSTQFSGGSANRPLGIRHFGQAQGAAAVALSLSNFMMSSMHMMVRLHKDALREAKANGYIKNLSSAGGARKAFAQMLGTQAFFAGTMGMPLAGFMVKILEQMFGKEVHSSMREGVAQMFGDDDELGGLASDIAMNGVPSAFLGVDVGSRFSLGSVFGLSSYNGFDIGGFLGAGGSIVSNAYEGLSMAAQGDIGGAVQKTLPQAFKNPIELLRNDGDFRDQKGELLYEPNFGEKLAYAVGLRPKQLSDMRLQSRLMRTADEISTKQRREVLGEIAEKLLTDDIQSARQMVEQYAAETPYSTDEVMRSVVNIALERTQPRDFLDEGSKASAERRQQIAGTFPNNLPRASETQKVLKKKALGTKLSGELDMVSPVEMIKANLIDDYIRQNPNTPRTIARQVVDERMSLMGL